MVLFNQAKRGDKMILSNGKNKFKDNTFSFYEWSAPILQKPEEVIRKIHELNLIGKTVKDIVSIGSAYNLNHTLFDYYPESENSCVYIREDKRNPEITEFDCFAEIGEPLLIEFSDGDILAIDFSEGSCVRMDINSIPRNIKANINPCNFHANVLFKDIIGKELFDIQLIESVSEPHFTGSYGLELNTQDSYISALIFYFIEKGSLVSLKFSAFYDYGFVTLLDQQGQIKQIHNSEIDAMLEGFC